MKPCCTKITCFETAEFDSIRGEGKLCIKHATIEANDVASEG